MDKRASKARLEIDHNVTTAFIWNDGQARFAVADVEDLRHANPLAIVDLLRVPDKPATLQERASLLCFTLNRAFGIELSESALLERYQFEISRGLKPTAEPKRLM